MKFKIFVENYDLSSRLEKQLNEFSKSHEIKDVQMSTLAGVDNVYVLVTYEDKNNRNEVNK